MVAKIATGELEEVYADKKPGPSKPKRSRGGKARAKKLTAKQRSEIARKSAQARWGK